MSPPNPWDTLLVPCSDIFPLRKAEPPSVGAKLALLGWNLPFAALCRGLPPSLPSSPPCQHIDVTRRVPPRHPPRGRMSPAAAAASIWLRGGGIQPRGRGAGGVIPPPSSFLAAFSGSLNARVCDRHNKALYIPRGCQEIQRCSGGELCTPKSGLWGWNGGSLQPPSLCTPSWG